MTDDPVLREIRQLREDLREDMQQLRADIAARVLREVYDSQRTAMTSRIEALEKDVADAEAARNATRRWLLGAITAPVGVLVIQLAVTVIRL